MKKRAICVVITTFVAVFFACFVSSGCKATKAPPTVTGLLVVSANNLVYDKNPDSKDFTFDSQTTQSLSNFSGLVGQDILSENTALPILDTTATLKMNRSLSKSKKDIAVSSGLVELKSVDIKVFLETKSEKPIRYCTLLIVTGNYLSWLMRDLEKGAMFKCSAGIWPSPKNAYLAINSDWVTGDSSLRSCETPTPLELAGVAFKVKVPLRKLPSNRYEGIATLSLLCRDKARDLPIKLFAEISAVKGEYKGGTATAEARTVFRVKSFYLSEN